MTRVLYWSDLHLGHEFVANERGFETAEEHDRHIIDTWKATVHKKDQVWLLGDLTLGSTTKALAQLDELPGTKHLIFGNHDQGHPMHRKAPAALAKYLTVFKSAQPFARRKIEGMDVMLSHFPYDGDHAGIEDRYTQYRLRDMGLPLIHGHVHDEWMLRHRQVNVGVDFWMDGPPEGLHLLAMMGLA